MSLFSDLEYLTVSIANGQSLSAAIALGAKSLVGIGMPAAWTAAALTFQASPDGGTTWNELFDDLGNELTIPSASATQAQQISISPTYWRSVNMLKVRSGTSGTPVAQAAGRTLILVIRGLT